MFTRLVAGLHSPVLNAAFNSTLIEGQTKIYSLLTTYPKTFRLLMKYMYKDRIRSLLISDSSSSKQTLNEENNYSIKETKALMPRFRGELFHLTYLGYLVHYLLMPRLQNHVFEHLEVAQTKFHLVPL
jgi:hypothetical protein